MFPKTGYQIHYLDYGGMSPEPASTDTQEGTLIFFVLQVL